MSKQKQAALRGFVICFVIVYIITSFKIQRGGYWIPDSINTIFGIIAGLVGGGVAAFFAKEDLK